MISSTLRNPPRPAASPSRPADRSSTDRPLACYETDAFIRSLYAEHATSVRAYVRRILNDPHLAEDVVQEAMLRAWSKSDTLIREDGPVGGWLITVARNIALDRLRAQRSRPKEIEEGRDSLATSSIPDHAEATVTSIVMARALATLSPSHRAAVHEVYYSGRTCPEAAVRLGVPEGTVKSRIHHAVRQLRLAIEEKQI